MVEEKKKHPLGYGTAGKSTSSFDAAASTDEHVNNVDTETEAEAETETTPLIQMDANHHGKDYDNDKDDDNATPAENSKKDNDLPAKSVSESLPNCDCDCDSKSIWSSLTFGWFTPMLELGNKNLQLDPADLDLVSFPSDCTTDFINKTFRHHWNHQLDSFVVKQKLDQNQNQQSNKRTMSDGAGGWFSSPSLLLALYQSFGREFLKAGFLKLIHDLSIFVGPQVLNALIHFLRDAKAPLSKGLWLTVIVTCSQLLMSFCLRHYFFKCYKTGLQIRSSVIVTVYHKALVLKSSERQTRSLGEITNLLSLDAQRMQDLTTYLHAIWYSFIQIGLALYFLWQQLGASCLGGIIIMIIMMPVTKAVAQWLGKIQKRLMRAKDERVEINSEVLGSMKVIKLQAWEESFQDRLTKLRNNELQELWHYVVAQAVSVLLWSSTPLVVALATFATYVLAGHQLEVSSALTSLALFDILRFPLFMLPQVINRIVEAGVSLKRIQSFLQCEEHEPVSPGSLHEPGISLKNATFCYDSRKPRLDAEPNAHTRELLDKQWDIQLLKSQLREAERNLRHLHRSSDSPSIHDMDDSQHETLMEEDHQSLDLLCLKRINFECRRGEFIAVIGGVGSGKSSLVNAFLGEIRQLSGESAVNGNLSYFCQTPFILNDTVRNNILFSHTNDETIDEELYQQCLSSCALRHDLKLLPAGDLTEVGEKGITISGGQKARVALARAMYHNADISILDDPLAAVDAHVGAHLFEKCILDQLLQPTTAKDPLRRKTVVLITNALQYLSHPMVDRIVVFNNGRVVEQGTYQELSKNPGTMLSNFLSIMAETESTPWENNNKNENSSLESLPAVSIPNKGKEGSLSNDDDEEDEIEDNDTKTDPPKPDSGTLMTNEFKERETGKVNKAVYFAWGRAAGGMWAPIIILIVYGIVEAVNVSSKWWLTYWSQHGIDGSQMRFLAIYALINLAAIICTFIRMMVLMVLALQASRTIFVKLLAVVLHAPMSFFDTTPTGRIINRFSGDMYTLDVQLVQTLRSYLMTLMSIFSTIAVISTITPVFTLCLIPIVIFYLTEQAYFTTTYRELKRLDSIGRSPIYALLGETLEGVATIRAFGAQVTLAERLRIMLDRQQHAFYLIFAAQCWLAIRLELAGTMIITFACLSSVLQHGSKGGDETFASLAGLSISYALTVTQSLNWSVRMASDFEANMIAVERIEQYSKIESEADRVTQTDSIVPVDWPKGEILFKNAKLRYRASLPLVLKGLNIYIPAGAKVGIVGRTGAGKSTLMLALLRIVELSEGQILIDGIDYSQLGLAKLRAKISVIPQDPVLFSGTIRTNLDPFEEYPDEKLLDVMSRVGLYGSVPVKGSTSSTSLSSLGCQIHSLQDEVADGGSNFSVGQRQLIVIARALLCGSNIVIMDEATAAVDNETDARIQKVMRNDFKHATCLTVAHRINTILDSDYILVMSDGIAAEFNSPQRLMEEGGLFRELVDASRKESD